MKLERMEEPASRFNFLGSNPAPAEEGSAGVIGTQRLCYGPRKRHMQDDLVSAKRETLNRDVDEDENRLGRRSLREGYRLLKDSADEKIRGDANLFSEWVNSAQELHRKVKRPREQVADAEFFYDLSYKLLESLKSIRAESGPSALDFVSGILATFGTSRSQRQDTTRIVQVNWPAFWTTASIFHEAPGLSTFTGPLDISPKKRKITGIKRKRADPAQSIHPAQVNETSLSSRKSETDKNMEAMFRVLRQHKCVNLEELVLNRHCFAQSVENIFALSFLVKDGRAEITYGADGRHIVVPRNAATAEDRMSGKATNTQFVLRYDFGDWKTMRECVEEGKELMPHRVPSSTSQISTESPQECGNKGQNLASIPVRKNCRNRAREMSSSVEERTYPNPNSQNEDSEDEPCSPVMDCILPVTIPRKKRTKRTSGSPMRVPPSFRQITRVNLRQVSNRSPNDVKKVKVREVSDILLKDVVVVKKEF